MRKGIVSVPVIVLIVFITVAIMLGISSQLAEAPKQVTKDEWKKFSPASCASATIARQGQGLLAVDRDQDGLFDGTTEYTYDGCDRCIVLGSTHNPSEIPCFQRKVGEEQRTDAEICESKKGKFWRDNVCVIGATA